MNELVSEPYETGDEYWPEVWKNRELIYFLAWRDVLVRYKQTIIGIGWALVRPLLSVLIFAVVFGRIAKLPSEGSAPYPVLVYVAMIPAQLIFNAVTASSNSLIVNPSLVERVYFPRLILPISSVITCLIDFLIAFAALAGLLAWYDYWPDWRCLFVPAFVVLALMTSTGLGFWLSALNVAYRDFRHMVPFAIQLAMYVSPVGFSTSVVPKAWRLLYSLNPAVGVIDGFRWSLLRGASPLYWPGVFMSLATGLALFVSGLWYFRKMENTFADVI
jgi:lipopolysaccharide transport system permease protein